MAKCGFPWLFGSPPSSPSHLMFSLLPISFFMSINRALLVFLYCLLHFTSTLCPPLIDQSPLSAPQNTPELVQERGGEYSLRKKRHLTRLCENSTSVHCCLWGEVVEYHGGKYQNEQTCKKNMKT